MAMIPKVEWEEKIFRQFCAAVPLALDAGSLRHGDDGGEEPDIICSIAGSPASFELAEVVDEGLAANHMRALKTMEASTGGAYGYHDPLKRTAAKHLAKPYPKAVGPLSLLLHFDKQHSPPEPSSLLDDVLGEVVNAALNSERWAAVWVFCTWRDKVLRHWAEPSGASTSSIVSVVSGAEILLLGREPVCCAACGREALLSVVGDVATLLACCCGTSEPLQVAEGSIQGGLEGSPIWFIWGPKKA